MRLQAVESGNGTDASKSARIMASKELSYDASAAVYCQQQCRITPLPEAIHFGWLNEMQKQSVSNKPGISSSVACSCNDFDLPVVTKVHHHPVLLLGAPMRRTISQGFETLARSWCKAMHPEPGWPMKGYYRCRRCNRKYRVPWEREEAVERVEDTPVLSRATAWISEALRLHAR